MRAPPTSHVADRDVLVGLVLQANGRVRALVDELEDAQLDVPQLPTVNPLRWEIGHVAFFWDVFVRHELDATAFLLEGAELLYDSFDVAHEERWDLPLPDRHGTMAYFDAVTEAVVARLDGSARSARETYLYELAACHADMHVEALITARQTLGYAAPASAERPSAVPSTDALVFDATTIYLGSDGDAFSFDNERPAHVVEIEPFAIESTPVTQGELPAFLEDGGYDDERLWSRQGNLWRRRRRRAHPHYWKRGDGGWLRRRFDRWIPLDLDRSASHLTWYEADAYCRWAKRRLPSEAEWECAARSGLDEGRGHGWLGGVWEWTADAFYPFPGYVVDEPYREYSAPWFGHRKVLKGGSWASPSSLRRTGFRNFFTPERDDVVAGLRTCAS